MAGFHHPLPRDVAAQYGRQAEAIIEQGAYQAPSGRRVELAQLIEQAVQLTVSYPAGCAIDVESSNNFSTQVEIANITTLAAARRLLDVGLRTVILNFASATHPGGGFLYGARAQEEYLARSSALYACLRHQPMYKFHKEHYDPLYSDYLIYSPNVPVFRADDGSLLETPYTLSIITAAAPNANKVPLHRKHEIEPAMRTKIRKVLAAASHHQHDGVVLGAWGCGAFGNDGAMVATQFRDTLNNEFPGSFARVLFAIRDWSDERKFIGPFERAFCHAC